MIRSLIVDDELISQRIMVSYIEDIPDMEVSGRCKNAIEATYFLKEHNIDLLFLDIEMPKIDGLDFLRSLQHPPTVILTTAYREFALDGFNLGVLDYLLKPIPFQRFFQAVEKYKSLKKEQTVTRENYLHFKSDRKTYRIHPSQIFYIEGLGNYIQLYLKDNKLVVYDKLSSLEYNLPDYFQRVHKSFIINTHKILAYSSEQVEIGLKSIPIGGSYKRKIMDYLKKT